VSYRVLVVDDYEPWRRHVREVLDTADWRIIGEASDGPDAIHYAHQLKPDLILLDVGLPSISGIKVAERILCANPTSKILFVSEHRSLAEAALAIGARGYIIKSNAGTELLPAMTAIVKGERFVGVDAASPALASSPADAFRHDAGFFASEAALLEAWAAAAETALHAGHSVIVLALESRLRQMVERLKKRGVALDRAFREGQYVPLEVHSMLAQFIVDDAPDELLFEKAVTPIVAEALRASSAPRPRVLVCGEGAPTLWNQGKTDAAIRLEQLWDELARAHEIDTLCGYLIDPAKADRGLRDIRDVHTANQTA
jgi:DNA-binding NarL/FixJ family response regulator